MPSDLTFKTKVSGHTSDGVKLRGEKLLDLIGEADFVSTLYLSITGKRPTKGQTKLLNALLVASIDHGVNPASGFVPRVVAASGNDMLTAMASALLALGPLHGGAVVGAMDLISKLKQDGAEDIEAAALKLIKEYRAEKKRLPGFGHPVYRDVDPRTKILFYMTQEEGLDLEYLNIAKTLETHLEFEMGKKLVINIDGAMAAVLLTLGFTPEVGNAIFGLARVAGSIAHIMEEKTQNNGVRRLSEDSVQYEEPKE